MKVTRLPFHERVKRQYIKASLSVYILYILYIYYPTAQVTPKTSTNIVWRTIGAKIQLLNFACTFGIRYCSFTICTYICNSTFKFPISLLQLTISYCFTIQHPSLRNSTSKFTQFNIQVYAIQHPSLRNSTSKFTQFNIQVYAIQHPSLQFNIQVYAIQHSTLKNACFRYPTAIQSMTVSVGSENYQNSPCVGASKGRSRYPRQ